jgi:phage terminase small subunit
MLHKLCSFKTVNKIIRTRNVIASTTKAGYLKGDADIDGRVILEKQVVKVRAECS